MTVAAFIVAAMNIPQIIECSSPESATFDIFSVFFALESNKAWKNRIARIQSGRSCRDYDGINGEPTEFEWNIFPGFDTLQLCGKVKVNSQQIRRNARKFHKKNSIHVNFSTTFLVKRKTMKKNVWRMVKSSLYLQRSLVKYNGHLLVQVPRRSGILWKRTAPKEFGTTSRKRCCWNSQKADVQFSVQQHHFPGVSPEAKDTENCLYILLRIIKQLRLFFA